MRPQMRFVPVLLVGLVMAVAGDAIATAEQRGPREIAAQTTASAPAAAPAMGQQTAKPAEAGAPFTYNPEGRRDPFVSLVGKGNDPKTPGARLPGVPGLLINEVSVKGIVRNSAGFVALIQGPDNKTYVVKAGDRLMDGSVKAIIQDAVVFSQDVNDPLSLVKQKEIRKALRAAEGGRG
jgi:Tfp pilus assembly protein PilP